MMHIGFISGSFNFSDFIQFPTQECWIILHSCVKWNAQNKISINTKLYKFPITLKPSMQVSTLSMRTFSNTTLSITIDKPDQISAVYGIMLQKKYGTASTTLSARAISIRHLLFVLIVAAHKIRVFL